MKITPCMIRTIVLSLVLLTSTAISEKKVKKNLRGTLDNGTTNGHQLVQDTEQDTVMILVKVKNDKGKDACMHNATSVKHMYDKFGILEVEMPRSKVNYLRNNNDIEYVDIDEEVQMINPIVEKAQTKTFHQNIAQTTPWGIAKVLQGTNLQPGPHSSEIKVCVIDTGYDLGHPDLPLVDGTSTGSGLWNVDGNGHGTHCAGTIAALNNNEGVVGVIGNASGITFHIGKGLTEDGSGTFGDIMAAFDGCVDAGAKIVSMSLGCSNCIVPAFEEMIMRAYYDFNILTIAAAGNDGNNAFSYPASYKAVMSVAAMDESEIVADFSQRNNQVEITGPGVLVESTWKDNGYNTISGTSMATPHVSGVAALLWSHNPDCTAEQIRKILLASARPLGEENCTVNYGYGLVQAQTAVDMLMGSGCDAGELARPAMLDEDGLYAGCHLPPPCSDGKVAFTMTVTTDDYPGETTWTLVASNGGIQASGGPYSDQRTTYQEQALICIGQTYNLTVQDSAGDGLCCSYGYGNYTAESGNQVIKRSDGVFSQSESTSFVAMEPGPITSPSSVPSQHPTVSQAPAQAPTPLCNNGSEITLTLDLTTDQHPGETTWEVSHSSGRVVASGGPYPSEGLYHEEAPLCLGETYNLTVNDSAGDGLCCDYGRGSYIAKTGNQVVKLSKGQFSSSESTTFVAAETTAPTQAPTPTCIDGDITFTLYLTTDNFPQETIWDVTDSNGVVQVSGGPYDRKGRHQEQAIVCLGQTYALTVHDSFGDGVCCKWGSGKYMAKLGDEVIIESDGLFNVSESTTFFAGGES